MPRRYVPIWRDPRYLRRRRRKGFPNWFVGAGSVGALALLLVPGKERNGGFDAPVSYELSEHDPVAWSLVLVLGLVLLAHAQNHFRNQRKASAVCMWLVVLGLVLIGITDPHSSFHLGVFVTVAILEAGWLFLIGLSLEETWLLVLAVGAAVGIIACQLFVGIGERFLAACCLAGINLVQYNHLDDEPV